MAVADRATVVGNDARHVLIGLERAVGHGEVADGAASAQSAEEGSYFLTVGLGDSDTADGVALSVEAYHTSCG